MAAAPAAIPFRINHEDRGANTLTESIDCAIRSTARTIARVHLKDKIRTEIVLMKAGLKCLNELVACASATMVWKSKMQKDPLAELLFCNQPNTVKTIHTRSDSCEKARQPVPGNQTLAANLMARAWNESKSLQNSTSLNAAKLAASNWARSLKIKI